MMVELHGYKDDINIVRNYGFLNRIIRSILIAVIYFGLIGLFKPPPEINILLLIMMMIIGSYVGDKHLRSIYSDWPRSDKFDKRVFLYESKIEINDKKIEVTDIKELLLFWNYYKGYSTGRFDPERNGNALLFCKHTNGLDVIKLNIDSKQKFDQITELIGTFKNNLPYFKTYHTTEIQHIIKPDYSDRIKYQ